MEGNLCQDKTLQDHHMFHVLISVKMKSTD